MKAAVQTRRAPLAGVVLALLALSACDERGSGASGGTSSASGLPASVSESGQPWLDLFAAVRAKDFAKAHAQMVAPYRASVSAETFRAAIEANPLVAQQTDATTFSHGGGRGDGGSLHAEGSIATPVGVVRFSCFYVHEAGTDRLVTLIVAGVPVVGLGVPTPSPSPSPSPNPSLGPNAVVGTFEMAPNESMAGEIVVKSVAPLSFDLQAVRKRPSAPHGELQAASATVVDAATAVFSSEQDCKITLRFEPGAIAAKQEGDCSSAGFGAFVDVSGRYLKK